jgi:hypothetical protein
MAIAVDLICVGLILGLTWALMSEGLWGAALMFFNILFAVLVAFNFYEPLAVLIVDNVGGFTVDFADVFCLMMLFLITLVMLRLTTETMAPAMVRFPNPVYHIGRIAFGLLGGALTVAFLLVALDTAPVHKKVLGVITYETRPPFHFGLDHRLLAFVQRTSGAVFANEDEEGGGDPFKEFGNARVFDPRGRWLIDHEDARPFGSGQMDAMRKDAGGSEGGGGTAGEGMGIPGGTGGAAVGLAPTNF